MTKPQVVILGAGPAGLGAAFQLSRRQRADVVVLEANSRVGGNAGSFELAGLSVDFGSHRLHPACKPVVLGDIQALLGSDLLDRPRHGRIRLRDRWIHFPLKPLDLATRLPPSFALGAAADTVRKRLHNGEAPSTNDTFASVLEDGLGRTICHDFYFPYARKIWGLDPEELSATQARRRVSASSPGKMIRKVLSSVPGFKPKGSGRFYYPRHGYGQICNAYEQAARKSGADIRLNCRVQKVDVKDGAVWAVQYENNGLCETIRADYVWSTIPITRLARCLNPQPPSHLLDAADRIEYRAMILIYLVLGQNQFSEFDAHYFPEPTVPISRLSEPKNYSASSEPRDVTVLCAELPCAVSDPVWNQSDQELGMLVRHALDAAGIPIQGTVLEVATRRLRQAYPIYRKGYEAPFEELDDWIGQFGGLLTFGRQGLFAHDNTHHALYMAYSAVDCLSDDGSFDRDRWHAYRREFESHVVED